MSTASRSGDGVSPVTSPRYPAGGYGQGPPAGLWSFIAAAAACALVLACADADANVNAHANAYAKARRL